MLLLLSGFLFVSMEIEGEGTRAKGGLLGLPVAAH
jgi:hypothetical protein